MSAPAVAAAVAFQSVNAMTVRDPDAVAVRDAAVDVAAVLTPNIAVAPGVGVPPESSVNTNTLSACPVAASALVNVTVNEPPAATAVCTDAWPSVDVSASGRALCSRNVHVNEPPETVGAAGALPGPVFNAPNATNNAPAGGVNDAVTAVADASL